MTFPAKPPSPGWGVGLRNVGSYQISGHPFITGSVTMGDGTSTPVEHKIEFPFIAKSVTVVNSGSIVTSPYGKTIKVHFTSISTGNVVSGRHYIALGSNEDSFTFDIKCKEIYISSTDSGAGYMLFASLTNVPTSSIYPLTGSGITSA